MSVCSMGPNKNGENIFGFFLIFIMWWVLFIIPEAALVLGVVILIAIVLSIVVNYKMFQKMLWNQWVIWVENGLVRDIRENYSEVPCDRIIIFL